MIENLDQLEAFLKMCRKQGVNEIKTGGISVSFSDVSKRRKERDTEDSAEVQSDSLSDEEAAFYSVMGSDQ